MYLVTLQLLRDFTNILFHNISCTCFNYVGIRYLFLYLSATHQAVTQSILLKGARVYYKWWKLMLFMLLWTVWISIHYYLHVIDESNNNQYCDITSCLYTKSNYYDIKISEFFFTHSSVYVKNCNVTICMSIKTIYTIQYCIHCVI